MHSVFERPVLIGILALVSVLAMFPSHANAGSCGQIQLKDASGVIGTVHGYTFSAVCSWSYTESKKSFSLLSGFQSESTNYGIEMDVVGKGKWDRKSGEAKESVSVKGHGAVKGPSGSFTGERVAMGNCNQDPFLKDPPGGAAVCKNMIVQYKGTSGPIFDVLINPKSFLLEKKISLVEAQALSGKKSSGATPPPPPPKPPKKEPIEASDSLGASGGVKASPGPVAAVAKPNLVVEGHRAKVEPNCQSPKPAVTVKLTIRNSGGPLPANKGTVYVKEFGGASLSSGGVSLPAISPGQQHTVELPVISLQPYSSLSGKHSLQVVFNPQVEEGKPVFSHPSPPFTVDVSFPSDHCKSMSRPPPDAAGTSAPARGGLPAAPPVPPKR